MSPWAAVRDFKSLGKTHKLPCTGDCYSAFSPDQTARCQEDICPFSPVTVFINTAVFNLFYPVSSFLLSLRYVLTHVHTHRIQDVDRAIAERSQPQEEVYKNHRIMSHRRVQSSSPKEGPSPKSDQAAGDHVQSTSEYPHGQIFHRIMQELKLLSWDMDQGWKVATQPRVFCYFAPLHCFPFPPSAESGSSQYHFSWHLSLLHGHDASLFPAAALLASLLPADTLSLNPTAWELWQ